ncbi:MAG TPA: prepilin-type N-terminal cleavage/methylation domain-containing protein [Candidatus Sulfotelmatobacter sp.]|nr:prepilin-type N-terminal cleavage/methylation domain-containing protein [Candidatus Sulfotelmatobacter sp.]
MKNHRKNGVKGNQGFSLVEFTVAMFILVVGVLGGMFMILMGLTRDNSNRIDTTATNAAQAVLEEIAGAPVNTSPNLPVTDCEGKNFSITTTGSANPGLGAPLNPNNGDIDFKQAAVAGYQMNYAVCGSDNTMKTVYDVRWHVTLINGGAGKLVVVSARQPFVASQTGIGFIRPVTLRTIVGM